MVLAVLGTVFGLPEMQQRLHLDFAQTGHLFVLLYLGIFLANLVVGPLIDAAGHKHVLLIAALLVAAALGAFSGVHSFLGTAPVMLLLGFGSGGLCTAGNVLVSDHFREQRGAMLNLLGVSFPVGALLVPLLASNIGERFTIAHLLWAASGLALACGLLYASLNFPAARAKGRVSIFGTLRVLRFPGLLWIGVLLFFESGNEAAASGWTSIYAGAVGLPPRAATLVLACYWAGMMISRLLAPQVLRRLGKPRTILAAAVASVFGCILLLAVSSVGLLASGAAVVGFSFGPIFQTGLGIAGDRYADCSGSVFGLMFAFALLGAMVSPWAIGTIAQSYTPRYGMAVPLLGAVCISLIAARLTRKEQA
jgi:fucose permease